MYLYRRVNIKVNFLNVNDKTAFINWWTDRIYLMFISSSNHELNQLIKLHKFLMYFI